MIIRNFNGSRCNSSLPVDLQSHPIFMSRSWHASSPLPQQHTISVGIETLNFFKSTMRGPMILAHVSY